jgi:hypothetical protein
MEEGRRKKEEGRGKKEEGRSLHRVNLSRKSFVFLVYRRGLIPLNPPDSRGTLRILLSPPY